MTGGGGGDNDITSRTEPWSEAKPYYEDMYANGATAYDLVDQTPYAERFYAGENAYDLQSRNAVDAAALGIQTDISGLRSHGTEILSGTRLDPSTNPFLSATVGASLDEAE